MHYLRSNTFLKDQMAKNDAQSLQDLFQALKYEDCPKGETVFKYGEAGVLFYVILSGEVEIKVPQPYDITEKTPAELLICLVTHYESICWDMLPNGFTIKRELKEQLAIMGLSLTAQDRQELMVKVGRQIVAKHTDVHRTIWNMFDFKKTTALYWLKTAKVLKAGASFGERALIKHEGRSGSAYCLQDCVFATLHRKDYNLIIG
jgi:CRP-like cAMP-binding protein